MYKYKERELISFRRKNPLDCGDRDGDVMYLGR